jgi:hypothetical protein
MPDSIGPHLLGRIPSPPDARDYRLENFLSMDAAAVDPAAALAELKLTTVSYPRWAATNYADITQTHWWKALNYLGGFAPPPPPASGTLWQDPEAVLDQGNFGTCVGNGCAQWGNTLPIDDKFTEKDARAIYYEATVLDGSPDDPDSPGGGQQGATVRSGVKALKNRNRLSTYAFASSLDTALAFLQKSGPVIVGTDWMNDMFDPVNGFVKPTGGVAGGHCYLLLGYDGSDVLTFLNSWGANWGLKGYFKMHKADFESLFSNQGELAAAVELPSG